MYHQAQQDIPYSGTGKQERLISNDFEMYRLKKATENEFTCRRYSPEEKKFIAFLDKLEQEIDNNSVPSPQCVEGSGNDVKTLQKMSCSHQFDKCFTSSNSIGGNIGTNLPIEMDHSAPSQFTPGMDSSKLMLEMKPEYHMQIFQSSSTEIVGNWPHTMFQTKSSDSMSESVCIQSYKSTTKVPVNNANISILAVAGAGLSKRQRNDSAERKESMGTQILATTSTDKTSHSFSKKKHELASDTISLPVRPLSAYNFFFSDERERIISGKVLDTYNDDKKQRLLSQHLTKDRSKPRRHRKTHGKINFTSLSRIIGHRWRNLPEYRKDFYRDIAMLDLERYKQERSRLDNYINERRN